MKFRLMLRRWMFADVPDAQKRFEHEASGHDWEIVGVQPTHSPEQMSIMPSMGMPKEMTTVLRRCKTRDCGEMGTYSLAGHWTLDQIRGDLPSQMVESLLKP